MKHPQRNSEDVDAPTMHHKIARPGRRRAGATEWVLALLLVAPALHAQEEARLGSGGVVGRKVASHTEIPSGITRAAGTPAVEMSESAFAAAIQFIVRPSTGSEVRITVHCEYGGYRYYAKDFAITRIYAKNTNYPSSGHSHGPAGRPVGQFSPDVGYGRDYYFVTTYDRGPASGDEIIAYDFVATDPALPEPCRGKGGSTEIPGAIRVDGLVPIQPARWLWMEPPTSPHYGGLAGGGMFGVPELGKRLVQMSEEYFQIARHSLRLNAASLVHGGVYDVGGDWARTYDGHTTGRDALVTGDLRRPNTPTLLVEAGTKAGLTCTPVGSHQARCSVP